MSRRLGGVIELSIPLSLALGLVCFAPLQRWDHAIYDVAMGLFARPPDLSIVLIGIDERSVRRLGRWPWSRAVHARFLDKLTEARVRAVGFDVLFSESDTLEPEADRLLAEAIARNGRVVLPVAPVHAEAGGEIRVVSPLPEFEHAVEALGHVDVKLDEDGVVRRVYLRAGSRDRQWPFFSLAVANITGSAAQTAAEPAFTAGSWWQADPILVAYAGPPGKFRQLSYVDILEDADVARHLRDRVVLVGMTAAGLGHQFATPVSAKAAPMSGLELHAQVLDGLQRGLAIQPLDLTWQIGLTALLVFMPWLAYVRLSPWRALIWGAASLALTLVSSLALMRWSMLWFAPVPALLGQALGQPLWSWRRREFAGRSLHQEKNRTEAILHAVGDGVIATDMMGRVSYMNPVAERLTGYDLAKACGRQVSEILPLIDNINDLPADWMHSADYLDHSNADLWQRPLFLSNQIGEQYAVRVSINPIAGENELPVGRVLALTDISETLRISHRISFLATHDPLTELPNRILLEDRLALAMAHARRYSHSVAVLFLDLDNFKHINDGLGHAAGDALLKSVGTRLRASVREGDSVARWGGDEFVIVLVELLRPESAADVASKIQAALSAPFRVDDQDLYVSVSIGISLYPQDGETSECLLRFADAAMYRTKSRGCNHFGFYSRDFSHTAMERLRLEKDLHEALARTEFEVFYQPQWDPHDGRIIGAEALIRWRQAERGLVMPDTFIPLAEETGLIVPMGEWLMRAVCRQSQSWRQAGLAPASISINLSPRQFLQPDLYDRIAVLIREHGLPGHVIKLEITENLMTHDVDRVAELLTRLKALGLSVAIDDFGIGYSSLSLLKRLPIDQLKIDKSFVRHILTDSGDMAIARSVISLAHNMKLSVIAEGIESESQLAFFREHGCDGLQGYYFSPPLAAADMTRLLDKSRDSRLVSAVLEK